MREEKKIDSIDQSPAETNLKVAINNLQTSVKDLRKKYSKTNLYFYKCMKMDCMGYQFLHNEKCTFCETENEYFDSKMDLTPEERKQE